MNARVEKIINLPVYQRVLIVVVTMILLAAGFYFLLFQAQQEEHTNAVRRLESANSQYAKNQRLAKNLPIYKAEYERLQEQLKLALNELPDKKEIPTLLTNIGKLAKDQGLDILRFKPLGESPRGFYAEVPVELKMSGSYHDVALFFDTVGKMSRIVNIEKLKLGGAKRETGKTTLSIECRAITYRFVEELPGQPKKGGKRK